MEPTIKEIADILVSLHGRKFPERESDEFDAGYAQAVEDMQDKIRGDRKGEKPSQWIFRRYNTREIKSGLETDEHRLIESVMDYLDARDRSLTS